MIPSIKTLERAFPGKGKKLRALLDKTAKTRDYASVRELEKQCYHAPGYMQRLETALNEVLEGFGAESIADPDSCTTTAAFYINMGDTYTTTLLYDRRRWHVTTWGDWVEAQERKGRVFP